MNIERITDKPGIPAVVLDSKVEEVLGEAAHRVCLWLHADGAFDGAFTALGHERACAPAVAAHPPEGVCGATPGYCFHHARHFLV